MRNLIAATLLTLITVLAGTGSAWAQGTGWTGAVGGATAYPDDFWASGQDAAFGDYYSPFYWPQGQNVVHTLSFNYSGTVPNVGIGFQIRGRAGTTFLEPARILDEANGACPGPAAFEYSVDGITWSGEFVAGAKYILYQTNTNSFINQSPRDGTPCNIGVLATADRLADAQSTTNADLYRLMDATPASVHNSSLYSLATTSESDFTQQAFSITADKFSPVGVGETITFTATMTSLKTGTPLTARFHEIDLSRLLDDTDLLPEITTSSGSVSLADNTIVWSSDGSIPNGQVVTITFKATVKSGGDGDLRAVVNGPTGTSTFPFNLHSGPRSNCQTVPAEPNRPGQGDVIWVVDRVLSAAALAAMPPQEYAATTGACAVVLAIADPSPAPSPSPSPCPGGDGDGDGDSAGEPGPPCAALPATGPRLTTTLISVAFIMLIAGACLLSIARRRRQR